MNNDTDNGIVTCVDCGEYADYELADDDAEIAEQTGYFQDSKDPKIWRCLSCHEYVKNHQEYTREDYEKID